MKTVTVSGLRDAVCEDCGIKCDTHDTLTLSGRCHPGAAVYASFQKREMVIRLKCGKCHAHVVDVSFAVPS